MSKVRLGIIGLGSMGLTHCRNVLAGKVRGLNLVAVADPDASARSQVPGVRAFASAEALIASGEVEAVLIATPHFSHTSLGIAALETGLHVLVEKPISAHKADAERLVAAHTRPDQVFAAMFNQRTDPYYQEIKKLIQSGALGQIRRINWIITDWFRTWAYYASAGWRATWEGEGGGVLLNQCPHNLDMLQWLFGQPERVRAFCKFGRYHPIEVEDDFTAYLEFPGGATGVFIGSTGEAPGTHRLEIAGERGRLVYENDEIAFVQNEQEMTAFSRTTPLPFARPATSIRPMRLAGHGGQHVEILQNFADAILHGATVIAPGSEGVHSVELANAMLLSTWEERTVELPLSGAGYAAALKQQIAASASRRKIQSSSPSQKA